MPITTVYSGSNDGRIESFNATASTAKAGSSLGTSGTGLIAYTLDGGYTIEQTFIDFDTTAITGQIVSATLSLYGDRCGSVADTVQARLYDYGASITTADYRTPTQFSACTLLAHLAFTSWSNAAYNAFGDDALAANINKGGHTRIVLCTALFAADGTASAVSYLENIQLGGDTNKPKLVITTANPTFDARVSRAAYLRM